MFIHLLVDGHLGCYQFGAIVNNAALNICVQVLRGHVSSFILGKYLKLELLAHMVTLCLAVWPMRS